MKTHQLIQQLDAQPLKVATCALLVAVDGTQLQARVIICQASREVSTWTSKPFSCMVKNALTQRNYARKQLVEYIRALPGTKVHQRHIFQRVTFAFKK